MSSYRFAAYTDICPHVVWEYCIMCVNRALNRFVIAEVVTLT